MDATSDPVSLAPGIAQNLVNLQTDRHNLLRAQQQLSNLSLSNFSAGIDGIGYLYAQNVTYSSSSSSTTPNAARLAVASNGTIYSYPLVSPVTWPPTFNTGSVVSGGSLITGNRVRFAAFGQELYAVQEGNAYENYRMLYNGTIMPMGIPAPTSSDWSATVNGTAATVTTVNSTSPIELTTSTAMDLVTGDTVIVSGVTQCTNANGTWAVTVIDSTHITLQGSTNNATGTSTPGTIDYSQKSAGVVQYTITFYDSLGRESSPCNTPVSITYGSGRTQDALITVNFAAYTSTRDVQGANIYATAAGESLFYLIGSISTSGGTIEDNYPDSYVQSQTQAPYFGENDPPLPASLIAVHKNRLWLNVVGTNQIQISNSLSATQFNSQGFRIDTVTGLIDNPTDGLRNGVGVDQGDSPTALVSMGSLMVIFRRRDIYIVSGEDLTTFNFQPIHSSGGQQPAHGCIAPDSAVRCGNEILYLSDDGVYMLSAGLTTEKISKPIESLLAPLRVSPTQRAYMEQATAWFCQNEYRLAIYDTVYVFNFDFRQWKIEQY